jgi:hypothetical protein
MRSGQKIKQLLLDDLNRANRAYVTARVEFDALIARIPDNLPEPPGDLQTILAAGNRLSVSKEGYIGALVRYSDFVTKGTVPEDLKS